MSDATTGTTGEPAADADAGTIRSHFEGKLGEKDGTISTLQVENLVLRSLPGIDTSKPAVQAFIAGYKGEMTPEKVAEAAAAWDIKPAAATSTTDATTDQTTTTTTATTTAVSQAEKDALAATGAATGATTTGGPGDQDPTAVGLANFDTKMKEGQEREVAAGAFLDSVFGAAAKGDDRVILQGGRQGSDS